MSDGLERLWARIQNLIGRGRIQLGKDNGPIQIVQVLLSQGEVLDLRRMVEYGLASMPPAGSDCIAIFIAGDRSNGAVVGTNHQASRPRGLAPGESKLYDGIRNTSVYLSAAGIVIQGNNLPITIETTGDINATAGGTLTATAPTIKLVASTEVLAQTPLFAVTGDIIDNVGGGTPNTRTMAQMRVVYNGHEHVVTGIQTGSGSVTSNTPTPPPM